MIKYVIFDMDGTLLDTEPIYKKTWVETGERWGLDGMEEMYPYIMGKSIETIIIMMKERFGDDFNGEKFFDERMSYFTSLIENGVSTRPGCFELLDYLKSENIPMALATSTPLYITERNMERTGIGKYMDAVVTSSMVKRGKPAPDIFLEAARRIGAAPCDTVVCEDSPYGIIAAHDAGMKPVFIPDLTEPSDDICRLANFTLNSLADVIEVIKKENKEI